MSTGFVATRKTPPKPLLTTGPTMDLKTAVFLYKSSSLDSPGFWFAPAQIATISASEQSL